MAATIRGRDHAVHFTNGGADRLYSGWLHHAERLARSIEDRAVVDFLRSREVGDGYWQEFDLDVPPDEAASPARVAFLARALANYARADDALMREEGSGDGGDRWAAMEWLARLAALHAFLQDALEAPLREPLALDLAPEDQRAFEAAGLDSQLRQLRGDAGPARLALLERLIAVARESSDPGWSAGPLLRWLELRAMALEAAGRYAEAAQAWREVAAREPDPAMQQANLALAAENDARR